MFKMSDLDGDGLLSRDEFNWFAQKTEGEGVDDEKWEVVEGNKLFFVVIFVVIMIKLLAFVHIIACHLH